MAIITAANFDYKGPLSNFERDSYATLNEMVNVNENYLPDVFIGVCIETGKAYLYNKANSVDPTLKKWRELVGGTDITDYIRNTDNFSNFEPAYNNEIVQYIGTTTSSYINGYFYKAVAQGTNPETYVYTQIDTQPNIEIINNTNSTDIDKALSANMGKNLQDQIDSISGRGRYLTLWDCSTGLAETNPPESPYIYRTGDYFIVGTVAASGGTNYRPTGSSYTTGVASTVVETDEVNVDDTYIYDGTTWHLQYNSQKTVSFANIDGDPYDNTNLSNALNDKVSTTSTASQVYGTDNSGNQTTYNLSDFGQIDNVAIHGKNQTITNKTVDLSVVEQVTTIPTANASWAGRVIQYVGSETTNYKPNYFYKCVATYVDNLTEIQVADPNTHYYVDIDEFLAYPKLHFNTPYTLTFSKGYWDDGDQITFFMNTIIKIQGTGVNSQNDQVILEVDEVYTWERVDVQPNTAVWGSIEGTLADQTDLQTALDNKVSTTSTSSQVYGTDGSGNQTTYSVSDFGQIDNIQIHGQTQTVTNKTVNLNVVEQVTTIPTASATYIDRIVQYIGTTTSTYTNGYFYKCILESGNYRWLRINIQPETVLEWGNITGTLADQTDLQTALDDKIEYAAAFRVWEENE